MRFRCSLHAAILLCAALALGVSHDADAATPEADDPLVDLASVDETILVELRYATTRNITGKPLYPPGARCIVRQHVAEALKNAQDWLRLQGCGLKIWDAYRPPASQQALFEIVKNRSFVASPNNGHPLHTWGAAVDATLVDSTGKELKMPTDFDAFTPAAAMDYRGRDPAIARHLEILHRGMARGGFLGLRTEWWHFIGKNWRACKAIQVDSMLPGKDGRWHHAVRAVLAVPTVQAAPSALGTQPAPAIPPVPPPQQPVKK